MRREGQEVLDRFALVVVLDIVPTVDESDYRGHHWIEGIGEPDAGRREGLAQTEHEGAGKVRVLETVDHLIPDQRVDLPKLNLQAVSERGDVLCIELLRIHLGVVRARPEIRACPREPRFGPKIHPRAKARPLQASASRICRFFQHELEQLWHKRVGLGVEDTQVRDVCGWIIEVLDIRRIHISGNLKAQGIPEGGGIRFFLQLRHPLLNRPSRRRSGPLGEYSVAAEL